MKGTLEKIARMLGYDLHSMPWEKLRYEHVQAIQTKLMEEGLAPASVNKAMAAISRVSKYSEAGGISAYLSRKGRRTGQ